MMADTILLVCYYRGKIYVFDALENIRFYERIVLLKLCDEFLCLKPF